VKPWAVALLLVAAVLWSAAPVDAAGLHGTFTDDDASVHERAIEAVALAGITQGCNPPTSDRFCPGAIVTRGQMAAFLHRGLGDVLTPGPAVEFVDDNASVFEADIEWLGATGVTRGCNPPANDRFCPDDAVTRGQMAAFLVRALGLTDRGSVDFVDDDGSVFEADIERLATAGITLGCNPPTNNRFCPEDSVTRAQMASFLARGLGLEQTPPEVDLSSGWWCRKDGTVCSGSASSPGGRTIQIVEGWDQALPFTEGEATAFRSGSTRFDLLIDGETVSTSGPTEFSTSTVATRRWSANVTTPQTGTFSIEGRWYWEDTLIRRTRIVVTIEG
jgi:hypothetical protein